MRFLSFLFVLVSVGVCGQNRLIKISAQYLPDLQKMYVASSFPLIEQDSVAYFQAWANAYSHKNTVLGKVKMEARKGNLYFSTLKERGWIENLRFFQNEKVLSYEIIEGELLKVKLISSNSPLSCSYDIKLPNQNISGYGVDSQKNALLKYFFIQPYEAQAEEVRNYKDFEMLHSQPFDYRLKLSQPPGYRVYTDLTKENDSIYTGKNLDFFELAINAPEHPDLYSVANGKITLGFPVQVNELMDYDRAAQQQLVFLNQFFPATDHPIFLSKNFNKNHHFFGADPINIPIWGDLEIFENQDRIDLQLFNLLSQNYCDKWLHTDMKSGHWIRNGIATYLQMEYIKEKHPDLRLFGKVPDELKLFWMKPLKIFEISKVPLQDRFGLMYSYFMRNDFDQKIASDFDELSNMNQLIVSKIKAGLAFHFLADFLGKDQFETYLKKFIESEKSKNITAASLQAFLEEKSNQKLDWFFDELLYDNSKIDFAISGVKNKGGETLVKIKNKKRNQLPFRISAYRNDSLLVEKWGLNANRKFETAIPGGNYDEIRVNGKDVYPEFNLKNNYFRPGKLFNRKLKVGVFKDIDMPGYTQLFVRPKFNWNNYDKFLLGFRLDNRSLLPQRFSFIVKPQYSSGEKELVGSLSARYKIFVNQGFLDQINLNGGFVTQHFDEDLAYEKYFGGISFRVRKQARTLKQHSLYSSFEGVRRDLPENPSLKEMELRHYNLFNFGYAYWMPHLIHERRAFVNFQISNKFSKLSAEYYYRWQFTSKKRLGVRLFAGFFLKQNLNNTDFYDFGLDRITDYTYRYNLLGRSETSGFLSQQFVLAEGGFKSNFKVKASQYLLSTNWEYPLWKIFDIYADAGVYKMKDSGARFVYDSGLRMRLIPDFIEFYFPIQSSLGFEPSRGNYLKNIRFSFNLNLSKVISYWRRGRF